MSALLLGDCLERMAEIDAGSVDAVVTDPPYGLAFMGKHWDHGVPGIEFWREMLRTIKPSGYLIAFGGTRTHHRLMVAIEDAGFQLRDTLMWMFGQGFPKGRGCLKPGYEPIILARKPGPKVLPLGIDACRIAGEGWSKRDGASGAGMSTVKFMGIAGRGEPTQQFSERSSNLGRWPANVILQHSPECNGHCVEGCPIAELDAATATVTHSAGAARESADGSHSGKRTEGWGNMGAPAPRFGDSGGASRFFYQAKSSRRDRNEGCEGMPSIFAPTMGNGIGGKEHDPATATPKLNIHPTVKPTDLMRWLIRLVSEPGATILDPFMGSGSTGKAAAIEGREFIGIERDETYFAIAEKRIRAAENAMPLLTEAM